MPLDELRRQIDEIDLRLVELLNRRAGLVQQVGQMKREQGTDVYVPAREEIICRRTAEANRGPLSAASLRDVFREILSACRALEHRQVVCYLGPAGSFTEEAAMRHFGAAVDYMANYGVVPVENSTVGGITDTLDRFAQSDLNICAEVQMAVHHCLMARCALEEVTSVYSKAQALGQCQQWLHRYLSNAKQCEADSTSHAAKLAQTEPGAAAIAHRSAAAIYELNLLATAIEDDPENVTRFLVLGHGLCGPTGRDRTSLMVALKHEAGALYNALLPFKQHKINLTKIESRPNRLRKWEYYFFIDLEGHCEDEPVRQAIEEMRTACTSVQVLGAYPVADRQL
jgi:chorismate mutase/prephenate dehydratase